MKISAEQVEQQLEDIVAEARRLTAGQSEPALDWRPEPHRWSVADCLEHLAVSADVHVPPITAAIARSLASHPPSGPPPDDDQEIRLGRIESWVVAFMEPPARLKMPAPRRIQPAGVPARLALPHFEAAHRALLETWHAARAHGLATLRIPDPFFPPLRFSGLGMFAMLTAHARRHLWQAARVVASPGPPSS